MGMGIGTGVDVLALFTAARMLEGMVGHPLSGRAWRADYPELGWAAPVSHEPADAFLQRFDVSRRLQSL